MALIESRPCCLRCTRDDGSHSSTVTAPALGYGVTALDDGTIKTGSNGDDAAAAFAADVEDSARTRKCRQPKTPTAPANDNAPAASHQPRRREPRLRTICVGALPPSTAANSASS